jgi:hypothetical protein
MRAALGGGDDLSDLGGGRLHGLLHSERQSIMMKGLGPQMQLRVRVGLTALVALGGHSVRHWFLHLPDHCR